MGGGASPDQWQRLGGGTVLAQALSASDRMLASAHSGAGAERQRAGRACHACPRDRRPCAVCALGMPPSPVIATVPAALSRPCAQDAPDPCCVSCLIRRSCARIVPAMPHSAQRAVTRRLPVGVAYPLL